jgi:phosphatidylserine decarboxylase
MKTILFRESIEIPILLVALMYVLKENSTIFTFLFALMFVFMYLYRIPYIEEPSYSEDIITSPCYGEILEIVRKPEVTQIKIYLSPVDVHVQWCPTHGEIYKTLFKKGEVNMAHIFEKLHYNEYTTTIIHNNHGIVRVDQIANQDSRRIVTWSVPKNKIKRGELIGMINLSSRVDLFLPTKKTNILVNVGEKLSGRISQIAKWVSPTSK